jgi:GNAT superfamily N-acetyltransferase
MPESSLSAVSQTAATSVSADRGLRMANPDDVRTLAGALADAFYDDPIFGWLMPDDHARLGRLRRFYATELRHVGLTRGHAWTSNELIGAAISTPPGAWRVPPRVMLAQGALFGRHIVRAAILPPAVERRHLREPHYYFAHIGVTPHAQGQGLGSALMGPILDRCDREGLPAYLEASSERSATLYERLGFRITRELRVASSPPLRLMVRPPAPSEGAR